MIRPGAACTGRWDLDWTPEREDVVVPAELRALCESCPVAAACLREAMQTEAPGYWAGTTTLQRDRTRRGLPPTITGPSPSLHPDRPASLSLYRSGCRCSDCRALHAASRRAERARARARAPRQPREPISA